MVALVQSQWNFTSAQGTTPPETLLTNVHWAKPQREEASLNGTSPPFLTRLSVFGEVLRAESSTDAMTSVIPRRGQAPHASWIRPQSLAPFSFGNPIVIWQLFLYALGEPHGEREVTSHDKPSQLHIRLFCSFWHSLSELLFALRFPLLPVMPCLFLHSAQSSLRPWGNHSQT